MKIIVTDGGGGCDFNSDDISMTAISLDWNDVANYEYKNSVW